MDLLANYTNIDNDTASGIVSFNGLLLSGLAPEFQDDKKIALLAVTNSWRAYQHVGNKLKADFDILSIAVLQNAEALQYADRLITHDDDIMRKLIALNPQCIAYGSDRLKNDKPLIESLIIKNGILIEYVSDELKDDKQLVLTAVNNNYNAVKYASKRLKKDKEFILKAMSKDTNAYYSMLYIFSEVACATYALYNFGKIKAEDKPLVVQALLENETLYLNPPAVIKELTENMEYPYLILANYVLNQKVLVHTVTELPTFNL